MNSIKLKVIGTILLLICAAVTTILFLAFYPTGFNVWQNIAVLLAAGFITIGAIVIIWIRMIPL
ncbi:MAG: hypothetical protein JSV35_03485 [Candidatus Bathyarchaeota archaeon]|nr:MAG: hypothetical protein JSV35_03485 [Candidatus Bathyarchaeota archaeon]